MKTVAPHGSENYLTTRVDGFTVEMDNSASELIDYMAKKTAT